MNLPRHAELWLPDYVRNRLHAITQTRPIRRIFVTVADHFEPYWERASDATAEARVAMWRKQWSELARRCVRDSAGNPPRYTFFYPQEEYRPHLMDPLAEMTQDGIADVEVHIHHDGEGKQDFIDRISEFTETLDRRHGLLRRVDGRIRFGFIHGNWALDNSMPFGRSCGLNGEIGILRDLGCYADFTMPSGNSPSQARTVNKIYWATSSPYGCKSYDSGVPAAIGNQSRGDLLLIPGPLGLRWRERMLPRLETGEIAGYDPPTPYRASRWFDLAPRLGGDVFLKLYTHGAQERNSEGLLGGFLEHLYRLIVKESKRRGCECYFVSAWQMYCQVLELLGRPHKSEMSAMQRVDR